MFISNTQSIMKQKAKQIRFETNGYAISSELMCIYNNVKLSFSIIAKKIENPKNSKNSIEICKEMINLYGLIHELLQNLLTECFRDNFYLNLEKMEPFFEFLNKVCKIMMAFDLLKIQNPLAFSKYCEAKLKDEEVFNTNVEEGEDNKICILNMISLPFGRLFLSFFCYPTFDLSNPSFLDKIMKIYLNHDSTKRISVYIYLAEQEKWQYLLIYLIALYYKLTGHDPFKITDDELLKYKKYLEMIKLHF